MNDDVDNGLKFTLFMGVLFLVLTSLCAIAIGQPASLPSTSVILVLMGFGAGASWFAAWLVLKALLWFGSIVTNMGEEVENG